VCEEVFFVKIPRRLKKWSITLKVVPLVAATLILKVLFHQTGLELIGPNSLLPSFVAATVFLMGFLISGVLSDYKEAERLPVEMAASIEALADEAELIYKSKKSPEAKGFLENLSQFACSLKAWFYKREKTASLRDKLDGFNDYFVAFELQTQATFVARMKSEQQNLRKALLRAHTIRETSFVQSGYAIAEAVSFLLLVALLLSRMEPFYESLFFLAPISFLFIYLLLLIRELDNPFGHYEHGESVEEVSLFELELLAKRLGGRVASLTGGKRK